MKEWSAWGRRHEKSARTSPTGGSESTQGGPGAPPAPDEEPSTENTADQKSPTEANHEVELKKRAKRQTEEAFTEDDIEQMMGLLEETTGHLGKAPFQEIMLDLSP